MRVKTRVFETFIAPTTRFRLASALRELINRHLRHNCLQCTHHTNTSYDELA